LYVDHTDSAPLLSQQIPGAPIDLRRPASAQAATMALAVYWASAVRVHDRAARLAAAHRDRLGQCIGDQFVEHATVRAADGAAIAVARFMVGNPLCGRRDPGCHRVVGVLEGVGLIHRG
jgi:hypothetical protein